MPTIYLARPIETPEIIFTGGGIGDLLLIESHWSDAFTDQLKVMHWANPLQDLMIPVFKQILPHVQHNILWDDWNIVKRFIYKELLEERIGKLDPLMTDWSIFRSTYHLPPYRGSRTRSKTLAKIDHLGLPAEFIAINHSTPTNSQSIRKLRDFRPEDWQGVLAKLHKVQLPGVVFGMMDGEIPLDPLLIDLRDKTTLCESIELLKSARGFWGIDSWQSVLAAQIWKSPDLVVRSQNSFLLGNKEVYYPTQTDFDFLVGTIGD